MLSFTAIVYFVAFTNVDNFQSTVDKSRILFKGFKELSNTLYLFTNSKGEADDCLPILIYVLLKSHPKFLISSIK